MAESRKSDGEGARRRSGVPKKVVAEWNRPSPRGQAVDRLIGQLVPELNPTTESSADVGSESSDG